jgi:hypothetical protein
MMRRHYPFFLKKWPEAMLEDRAGGLVNRMLENT